MFETANDWLLIKIFIDFLKVTKLCVNIVQINIAGNILLNEGLMFILAVPDNFIPTLYAADTSKILFYNVHAALHFPLKNLLSGMFDMKLWHLKKKYIESLQQRARNFWRDTWWCFLLWRWCQKFRFSFHQNSDKCISNQLSFEHKLMLNYLLLNLISQTNS